MHKVVDCGEQTCVYDRCVIRKTPSTLPGALLPIKPDCRVRATGGGDSLAPHLLRLDGRHHPVRLAAVVAVHVVKNDPNARHDEAHAEGDEDEDAAGDRSGSSSLDQVCGRT